jgi:hypothetical protein
MRGFWAGSSFAALLRFAATTVWLAGINAVFTAGEIGHSTALSRISEVFSTVQ